jgi:homoaconitase/3-isopropylmalate dehydratase large subunit/3-isopropylmalate dehydratase small subunit
VVEGHAAGLALRLFATLGIERAQSDLALASAEADPLARAVGPEELAGIERAARRAGLAYSRPGNGPGHQVYLARFAAPGRLVFGTAPRLSACGALGALALRVGPTEAAAALAGAPIEMPCPATLRVRLFGRPPDWLSGHDLALELERRFAFEPPTGAILEFHVLESGALGFEDRATLAAGAPEWGAASALFHSDEIARAFLKAQSRESDWKSLAADAELGSGESLDVDFSDCEPRVADPARGAVLKLRELGDAAVSAVWIGPEATRADLERLARALTGARVAEGVECLVTLGNRQLHETAAGAGWLAQLRASGVRIAANAWGVPRPRSGAGMALACGAPGARRMGWHETGVTACGAAAILGRVTDPRQRALGAVESRAETYVVDDRLLERPTPEGTAPKDESREAEMPALSPGITGPLRGKILLKVGDHVRIDQILPWGARVRPIAHRIDALARYAFVGIDPDFAARARAEGDGWVLAGRELGGGERREEVALVAVALGLRGMMARSFDPSFRMLLRRHGLLGLRFGNAGDAAAFAPGDEIEIPDLPDGLEPGKPLVVRNLTQGAQYTLNHDLDDAGVREVRFGGLLAELRHARASAASGGRREGAGPKSGGAAALESAAVLAASHGDR